uniref:Uncharacterized protein n=1 Tax=Oryza rufipogon TaxID=4529 RepID=A0A0E0RGX3_ORYRU
MARTGTMLREEQRSGMVKRPCDKVKIKVTHGGRIPCREDFATGFTRSSVQVPGSRRKWRIEEELQYFEVL